MVPNQIVIRRIEILRPNGNRGGARSQMGYNRGGREFRGGSTRSRDDWQGHRQEDFMGVRAGHESHQGVGGMTVMEIKAGWKSRWKPKSWTRGDRHKLSSR
jgi:hypothetical protein